MCPVLLAILCSHQSPKQVFADQSYHQRGIASNPATATKAFIIGGLAWSAVPLIIASSLGLAARAMYGNYPAMAMLTAAEVSSGLPGESQFLDLRFSRQRQER